MSKNCKMAAVIFACAAAFILGGCSVKSPDMYDVADKKVVSITAVCGDKKLKSVESVQEIDDAREQIYSQTVRYAYDKITTADIDKYQKRLIKDGFHIFSKYCYQTTTDKDGFFTEVKIETEKNAVLVSQGNVKQ